MSTASNEFLLKVTQSILICYTAIILICFLICYTAIILGIFVQPFSHYKAIHHTIGLINYFLKKKSKSGYRFATHQDLIYMATLKLKHPANLKAYCSNLLFVKRVESGGRSYNDPDFVYP